MTIKLNWTKLVLEYRDRIYIRKDILLKLYEYGELNQTKLFSYCGLNNVKHKDIIDDLTRKEMIIRTLNTIRLWSGLLINKIWNWVHLDFPIIVYPLLVMNRIFPYTISILLYLLFFRFDDNICTQTCIRGCCTQIHHDCSLPLSYQLDSWKYQWCFYSGISFQVICASFLLVLLYLFLLHIIPNIFIGFISKCICNSDKHLS